jgi:hypothetical protein
MVRAIAAAGGRRSSNNRLCSAPESATGWLASQSRAAAVNGLSAAPCARDLISSFFPALKSYTLSTPAYVQSRSTTDSALARWFGQSASRWTIAESPDS